MMVISAYLAFLCLVQSSEKERSETEGLLLRVVLGTQFVSDQVRAADTTPN
jgi:hypothetical protein